MSQQPGGQRTLLTWDPPCQAWETSTLTRPATLPAFFLHFDRITGCWVGDRLNYGLLFYHCTSLAKASSPHLKSWVQYLQFQYLEATPGPSEIVKKENQFYV